MPYRNCLIAAATAIAAAFMPSAPAGESAIQAHCLAKWSGDAMRAYCLEEQRQAADAVAGYDGPTRARCESDWGNDFHMVLFCIKEQQRLSRAAVADAQPAEHAVRCARELPGAYDLSTGCSEDRRAESSAN